jgi:thioredoxin 1
LRRTQNHTQIDWQIKELNEITFQEEIRNSDYPVLVDFWAAWCAPCRVMEPVLETLAETFEEKILFRKVNTDLYPSVMPRLNISGIPTISVFLDGEELRRVVGPMGKKQLSLVLNEVLESLPAGKAD